MPNETIFGINAVQSRLRLSADGVERLFLRTGALSHRLQQVLELGTVTGCVIERISIDRLSHMTDVNHQGVALEIRLAPVGNENDLLDILAGQNKDILLLVLDGITDPRNLGACLRSAATMGVHAVIVPKNSSAPLNDAAVKTASGGAAYVPLVQVVNLARCLRRLQEQGVWIVGTLLEAELAITDIDMTGHIALVMGSEEKGLRPKTTRYCDFLVSIPMINKNFGLNVSVATGICLYEANRQRQIRSKLT